jgi:hypothetical protein
VNITNLTNATTQILNNTQQAVGTSSLEFLRNVYLPNSILTMMSVPLLQWSFIQIDLWTFVHLIIGYLIGRLVVKIMGGVVERKKFYITMATVLIAYELFENFYLAPNGLAQLETIPNAFTDVLTGMIGAVAADLGLWLLIILVIGGLALAYYYGGLF